jgi:hypothetical protein
MTPWKICFQSIGRRLKKETLYRYLNHMPEFMKFVLSRKNTPPTSIAVAY